MNGSNYPPGVTGREPQITGEWPPDQLADYAYTEVQKAKRVLDDAEAVVDDQGGLAHLEAEMEQAQQALGQLAGATGKLAPPEVDPDALREAQLERAEHEVLGATPVRLAATTQRSYARPMALPGWRYAPGWRCQRNGVMENAPYYKVQRWDGKHWVWVGDVTTYAEARRAMADD